MNGEIVFQINHNLSAFGYEVLIAEKNNGEMSIASPVAFVPHQPGMYAAPTLTLQREELQSLLDELVRLGFQPSDRRYLNQQLEMKEAHLQDMRKIVSNKLKVDLL